MPLIFPNTFVSPGTLVASQRPVAGATQVTSGAVAAEVVGAGSQPFTEQVG